MKITALAPWFGAKRNMAEMIIEELGPHRFYWEPFCGSMAVLLSKPRSTREVVSDLNGDLTNLALVMCSAEGGELFDRLSRTMFCEGVFAEAKAVTPTTPIDRAYWFFVRSWMGRNGVAGTRQANEQFCVRWTSNGGDAVVRWRNAVASIPEWVDRLMDVEVLNRDAFEVLAKLDDVDGTAIYCDPPYLVKGSKYVHDFTEGDHERLAELLGRFKRARVVVSYYDHPRLDDLYPGWTKRVIEVSKALVAQGKRDKNNNVKAQEALLINGPSLVERKAERRELFA